MGDVLVMPCRSNEAEERNSDAEPMRMADMTGWFCERVWKRKWAMEV